MYRFIFAVTLAGIATTSTHGFAQERVARAGTIKTARSAAAAHVEDKAKTTAPSSAPLASQSGDGAPVAPTGSGMVTDHPGQGLADVQAHGAATATDSGASEKSVTVAVNASKLPPMIATPRLLRRMNADHVVAKLAEDFRACYVEDPAEKTADSAVVRVEIAASGAIVRTAIASGAKTTPQITACIANAASSSKFNPPGGIGTAVLVQVRTR